MNGYILHRNRRLKHGRKARRIEVKGRRGRRHKLIVDDFKETTGYWKLKEKSSVGTLWGTHFVRGYKLEVRHPRCVGSITKSFVYYTYSRTQL